MLKSQIELNVYGANQLVEKPSVDDVPSNIVMVGRKEISMLYILGIYFDNVKWYEHQMYNLPIDFKECINEICKKYLKIDPLMKKYTFISLELITGVLPPYHYTYHNTNSLLKEFFELLISNSKNSYKSSFEDILKDLNNVKIEKYYIDDEEEYT